MLHQPMDPNLPNIFSMFSCVGFKLAFIGLRGDPTEEYPMGVPIPELHATGAFRGATEAWDYARRNPRQVYADIERRGDIWHVDVITNAYGSGRYDCWFASVYPSLVQAYRALEWLSRDDWKVLREAPARINSGRSLTEQQEADMHSYVLGVDLDPNHEAAGDAAEARAMSSAADD